MLEQRQAASLTGIEVVRRLRNQGFYAVGIGREGISTPLVPGKPQGNAMARRSADPVAGFRPRSMSAPRVSASRSPSR